VWARGRVASHECPRSLITAESLTWIEKYRMWKVSGSSMEMMTARDAHALLMIEQEMAMEKSRDD
jgi:hypothetical protein